MRNLKKILALVLALVMSLSLMATASAEETTAVASDYALATKVLQGLDVVRGDPDGSIREADPITRAEAAALAYRIHTADVKDEKANLYYDLQDAAFTDLAPVSAWALGYIGYAHNAQIVKGNGDGTFNPTGNITGYEILAMALRAIGYGKNGEFEGAQWQINTAAWARREGLLEGVSPTDQTRLDLPASRGMVFQILFNTIQHDDVQFSYTTPDLYVNATGANNTMALRLGLDKITGVVMANEWAALDSDSVMADGKTRLKAEDGTNYTVDYASELTDIGESRIAYIRDDKTVLDLADSGKNNVKDNEGAEYTVNDLKDGLNINDAEHFENFAYSTKDTSEWIIRYVLVIGSTSTENGALVYDGLANWWVEGDSWYDYLTAANLANRVEYEYFDTAKTQPLTITRTIRPGELITSTDRAIMENIFSTADRWAANPDNEWVKYYVNGEVYVGTSSLEDKSDVMNWKDFVKTYIDTDETQPITKVGNGDWLKIIDNNQDGKAEYVLHTHYELDKVVDSITKNDKTTYYYNGLDITDYTFKGLDGYTPTVNDIVLYARIDKTVQMHKVEPVKATFKAVDYKERQATTTDGDVKEQSDIGNHTRLPQILTDVNENVEYSIYLDDYGYVRAYENKTSYALVTEVYTTNELNQGWVLGRNLTAEVLPAGQKAIAEYSVINSSYYNNGNIYNPFWTDEARNPIFNNQRPSHLKPATHMLDVPGWEGTEFVYEDNYYQPTTDRRTWTNVAEYVMGEDSKSINLYTAAKVNSDATNSVTDYIQLNVQNVSKSDPLYVIDDTYYHENTTNAPDNYVRAVDDTIFFAIASDGTIRQWTGYKSSDAVNLDAVKNGIHAMYAVATNTNADRDSNDHRYWVADVIVIELEAFTWNHESISLIYSNNYKIQGDVKYVQAIDTKLGQIGIIPNNVNIWNGQFIDYGFYGLRNVEVFDEANKIYKADIVNIHSSIHNTNNLTTVKDTCAEEGIHYGIVRSLWDEQGRSDYITVDVLDRNGVVIEKSKGIHVVNGAYGISRIDNTTTRYNDAIELTLGGHASNRVMVGDYVIWVDQSANSTSSNNAGFVIDLSDEALNSVHSWNNPAWLEDIKAEIEIEQTDAGLTDEEAFEAYKTSAKGELDNYAATAKKGITDEDVLANIDATLAAAKADIDALTYDASLSLQDNMKAVAGAVEDGKADIDIAADPTEPTLDELKEDAKAELRDYAETLKDGKNDDNIDAVLEDALAVIDAVEAEEDLDAAIAEAEAMVEEAAGDITGENPTISVSYISSTGNETPGAAWETNEIAPVTNEETGETTITLPKEQMETIPNVVGMNVVYTVSVGDNETTKDEDGNYVITFAEGEEIPEIIEVTVKFELKGEWVVDPANTARSARALSEGAAEPQDVRISLTVQLPEGKVPSTHEDDVFTGWIPESFQWLDDATECISESFNIWKVYAMITVAADEDAETIVAQITIAPGAVDKPTPETLTIEVVDAEGNAMTNWADYITITVGGTAVETLPETVEADAVVAATSKDTGKATVTVTKGTDKWTITVTVVAEEDPALTKAKEDAKAALAAKAEAAKKIATTDMNKTWIDEALAAAEEAVDAAKTADDVKTAQSNGEKAITEALNRQITSSDRQKEACDKLQSYADYIKSALKLDSTVAADKTKIDAIDKAVTDGKTNINKAEGQAAIDTALTAACGAVETAAGTDLNGLKGLASDELQAYVDAFLKKDGVDEGVKAFVENAQSQAQAKIRAITDKADASKIPGLVADGKKAIDEANALITAKTTAQSSVQTRALNELSKDLRPEQEAAVRTALATAQNAIRAAATEAAVKAAVDAFTKDVDDAVGDSDVTVTDPTNGATTLRYYLDASKSEKLTATKIAELLKASTDTDYTIITTGDQAGKFDTNGDVKTGTTSVQAFDKAGDKLITVTLQQYRKVFIGTEFVAKVDVTASATATVNDFPVGSYLVGTNVIGDPAANTNVAYTVAPSSVGSATGTLTVKAAADATADLVLQPGVVVTYTAPVAGVKVGSTGVTSGNVVKTGSKLTVPVIADVAVTAAAPVWELRAMAGGSNLLLNKDGASGVYGGATASTQQTVDVGTSNIDISIVKGLKVVIDGKSLGLIDATQPQNISDRNVTAGDYIAANPGYVDNGDKTGKFVNTKGVTLELNLARNTGLGDAIDETGTLTLVRTAKVSVKVGDSRTGATYTLNGVTAALDDNKTYLIGTNKTLTITRTTADPNARYSAVYAGKGIAINSADSGKTFAIAVSELKGASDDTYEINIATAISAITLAGIVNTSDGFATPAGKNAIEAANTGMTVATQFAVTHADGTAGSNTTNAAGLDVKAGDTVKVTYTFTPDGAHYFANSVTVTKSDAINETLSAVTPAADGTVTVTFTVTIAASSLDAAKTAALAAIKSAYDAAIEAVKNENEWVIKLNDAKATADGDIGAATDVGTTITDEGSVMRAQANGETAIELIVNQYDAVAAVGAFVANSGVTTTTTSGLITAIKGTTSNTIAKVIDSNNELVAWNNETDPVSGALNALYLDVYKKQATKLIEELAVNEGKKWDSEITLAKLKEDSTLKSAIEISLTNKTEVEGTFDTATGKLKTATEDALKSAVLTYVKTTAASNATEYLTDQLDANGLEEADITKPTDMDLTDADTIEKVITALNAYKEAVDGAIGAGLAAKS